MKAHCSTACGLHFVVGRTFEREKRYDDVEVRHMGGSTIQSSRDTGYLERMIKIRTDYEARWVNVVMSVSTVANVVNILG